MVALRHTVAAVDSTGPCKPVAAAAVVEAAAAAVAVAAEPLEAEPSEAAVAKAAAVGLERSAAGCSIGVVAEQLPEVVALAPVAAAAVGERMLEQFDSPTVPGTLKVWHWAISTILPSIEPVADIPAMSALKTIRIQGLSARRDVQVIHRLPLVDRFAASLNLAELEGTGRDLLSLC